jgi:signal transduction histidine kinase
VRSVPTLRGRLALVAALTVAVWVALLTAAFNLVVSSQLHAQSGSLLRQRAAAAAATVIVNGRGGVRIAEPADDEALDANLWIYAGKTALERPRAGPHMQQLADALADAGERFAHADSPRETRLYALPVRSHGHQVATVVAAVSLDPYQHVARLALIGSVGLALLLLAGVYAVSRLVVARALAPVQQMSTQAARWSELDASQRFGKGDRPAELARLADNLDGVLDRLEALLRHEQQVTEELSHELRTPLSLITAEVELLTARRRTATETANGLGRIEAGAAHMRQILETLLTAARSRSPDTAGRCSLRAAVDEAVRRLPPTSVAVRVTQSADVAAAVDGDVVERILAPLLDNATRYARSRIDVALPNGTAQAVLRIWDDGPGVAPELGEGVFEPGRRDASAGHRGAGLGLALARRLARASGGDLLLVDGAFELRLPKA